MLKKAAIAISMLFAFCLTTSVYADAQNDSTVNQKVNKLKQLQQQELNSASETATDTVKDPIDGYVNPPDGSNGSHTTQKDLQKLRAQVGVEKDLTQPPPNIPHKIKKDSYDGYVDVDPLKKGSPKTQQPVQQTAQQPAQQPLQASVPDDSQSLRAQKQPTPVQPADKVDGYVNPETPSKPVAPTDQTNMQPSNINKGIQNFTPPKLNEPLNQPKPSNAPQMQPDKKSSDGYVETVNNEGYPSNNSISKLENRLNQVN